MLVYLEVILNGSFINEFGNTILSRKILHIHYILTYTHTDDKTDLNRFHSKNLAMIKLNIVIQSHWFK